MRHRVAITTGLLLLASTSAAAHPLTDLRYDRTVAVRVSSDAIEVHYTLELSPLALHLDAAKRLSKEDIAALDKTARGLASAYAKRVAGDVVERLRVTVDGKRVPLKVTAVDVTMTEHASCRFTLRAAWPSSGRDRALAVDDATFPDEPGVLNLTLDRKAGPGNAIDLDVTEEPPARVRGVPLSQLKPADAAAARKLVAVVSFAVALAPMPHLPSEVPPDMGIAVSGETIPEPTVNADVPPAPNLFVDLYRRGLPALFDSTLGIGVLFLAAFLFGAAHAFTPGHGKTLVAAYLVGERGSVKHAVILGLATTVAHTGSVIALAAVLYGVYGNNVPGQAQGTLQFVAGLMVAGVGLWLLLRRVAGKSDHFHLFADHHHHHGDGHTHSHSHDHGDGHHHHHGPPPANAKSTTGWARLILMGIGGGLVPCWDAVLLLVAAVAMDRVGFAIPMLFAFSAGLGAVLVLLGVGVVYAHRAGATRFKDAPWFRLLPVISASLLVAIGFWLCKQAIAMAMK